MNSSTRRGFGRRSRSVNDHPARSEKLEEQAEELRQKDATIRVLEQRLEHVEQVVSSSPNQR